MMVRIKIKSHLLVVIVVLFSSFSYAGPAAQCSKSEGAALFDKAKEIVASYHCGHSRYLNCSSVVGGILGAKAGSSIARRTAPVDPIRPQKPLLDWPDSSRKVDASQIKAKFESFKKNVSDAVDEIDFVLGNRAQDKSAMSTLDGLKTETLQNMRKDLLDMQETFAQAVNSLNRNGTAKDIAVKMEKAMVKNSLLPGVQRLDSIRYAVDTFSSAGSDIMFSVRPVHPTIGDLQANLESEERIMKGSNFYTEEQRAQKLGALQSHLVTQKEKYRKYLMDLRNYLGKVKTIPSALVKLGKEALDNQSKLRKILSLRITKSEWRALKMSFAGGSLGAAAIPLLVETVGEEVLIRIATPGKTGGPEGDCGSRIAFADYNSSSSNGTCGEIRFDIGPNITNFVSMVKDEATDILTADPEHCEYLKEFVDAQKGILTRDQDLLAKTNIDQVKCDVVGDGKRVEIDFSTSDGHFRHVVNYSTAPEGVEVSRVDVFSGKYVQNFKPFTSLIYKPNLDPKTELLQSLDFTNPATQKLATIDASTYQRTRGSYNVTRAMIGEAVSHGQFASAYRSRLNCCQEKNPLACFQASKGSQITPSAGPVGGTE